MKHSFLIIAFLVVGSFSWFCFAQVACNELLVGTITDSIACSGACTLEGATVSGDVLCSTGSLVARGNTVINGNVMASGLVTRVELDAVNVLGSVTVIGASLLTEVVIMQAATLRSVKIENTPGNAVVAGSLTGLELIGSGNLFAANLSTLAIISISGGNGIIELCESLIGGLSVDEHVGDIEINANNENCSPTMFLGGLTVNKGSGRVRVIGANLPSGDFLVTEYSGDVTLQETQVSDVLVANTVGLLTLIDVLTDSDMSVSSQMGDVVLERVDVSGDKILEKNDGFLDVRSLRSDGDLNKLAMWSCQT